MLRPWTPHQIILQKLHGPLYKPIHIQYSHPLLKCRLILYAHPFFVTMEEIKLHPPFTTWANLRPFICRNKDEESNQQNNFSMTNFNQHTTINSISYLHPDSLVFLVNNKQNRGEVKRGKLWNSIQISKLYVVYNNNEGHGSKPC